MESKEHLTNEAINKKFNNQFELVNYAIGVAGEMIHSGRAPRTKLDSDNTALQVYEEIVTGTDKFVEPKVERKEAGFSTQTMTETEYTPGLKEVEKV